MIPKNVVLKLASIKYAGKSIGDDIQIEIKVLDQIFSTDVRLNIGETSQPNKEIGIFAADQQSFILPAKITITEKDPIFDDVASETIRIKVNFDAGTKQTSSHRIKVKETRKFSKGKEAIFEVTFEIIIQEAIRYFEEMKDGFLGVYLNNNNKDPEFLPAFLKVKFNNREKERDYFTILEGVYRGEMGSVKAKNKNHSYLLTGNFHTDSVHVTYSKSTKILTIKGKTYQTIDDPEEPWKRGIHDIEIADTAHKGGLGYTEKAPKAKVWFRIDHDGEQYIHTGQRTRGCITLTEQKKWDGVYQIFIRARKNTRSIGTLEIID